MKMHSDNLGIETDCDWGVPVLGNNTSSTVEELPKEYLAAEKIK